MMYCVKCRKHTHHNYTKETDEREWVYVVCECGFTHVTNQMFLDDKCKKQRKEAEDES